MTIEYDDLEYAASRLIGTVVRTKCGQRLCYIRNMYLESGDCDVTYLPNRKGVIHLSDLDLSPFELGFFNGSRVGYLVRMPSRQWKQGIRQQQLKNTLRGGVPPVDSSCFINMALNRYPRIGQCIESIANQEKLSMAFSKHFCLAESSKAPVEHLSLFFKGDHIGYVSTRKSTNIQPEMFKHYGFMSELFEEVMEKQNA